MTDFSTAGVTTNGNASIVGPVLEVTPDVGGQAGSAFRPIDLGPDRSFSTSFTARVSGGSGSDCCGDAPGADGMTFVIHGDPAGVGALGGGGGALGVNNISPAIIVEMDTWVTGSFDPPQNNGRNGNHLGIDINVPGFPDTSQQTMVQTGPGAIPQFNNGADKHVWVDYDGRQQEL